MLLPKSKMILFGQKACDKTSFKSVLCSFWFIPPFLIVCFFPFQFGNPGQRRCTKINFILFLRCLQSHRRLFLTVLAFYLQSKDGRIRSIGNSTSTNFSSGWLSSHFNPVSLVMSSSFYLCVYCTHGLVTQSVLVFQKFIT